MKNLLILAAMGGFVYLSQSISADTNSSVEGPIIFVEGNNEIIPNGNKRPVDDNFTDFGAQSVGYNYLGYSFAIRSADGLAHKLSNTPVVKITGSEAFVVTHQPQGDEVNTDEELWFVVKFVPRAIGLETAQVTVQIDQQHQPYTFNIQGFGAKDAVLHQMEQAVNQI